MSWEEATAWDSLVCGGFSDWRLPSAHLIDNNTLSYDSSTDRGYRNTRSELGHLFIELGNQPNRNTLQACSQPGSGFLNTSFIDLVTGKTVSFLNVNFGYWEKEPDPRYEGPHGHS